MSDDVIIKNGLYFDGSGADGVVRHLAISGGRVRCVSATPLDEAGCKQVIDAQGRWVTPGFIEPHSHYDAEIIAAPELPESVRHGVTTVMTGICSISMVCAEVEDCSDLFTRVEAVPREVVLPLLHEKKTWTRPSEFRAFFDQHPLGPNLAAFLGHSDLRAACMGLVRSVSKEKPTEAELQKMEALLEEALDEGFLGLSTMTTKLDRIDGDRAWAAPLPSTFARWSEYRRLHRILRRRGRVLQSAPDAVGKINVFAFLWESIGWVRSAMKISLLTALDLKAQPFLHLITRTAGWVANIGLGANLRWQFLPAPFVIYAYGLDFNSFGELADARILRDFKNPDEPYEEAKKPEFRTTLRKNMKAVLTAGLWHREFADGWVVECPDESLVGKNFAEIGQIQNKDAVDAFLDLAIKYKEGLRWGTQFSAGREKVVRGLCRDPWIHVGFADSGAHLKNLASYNFPLCFLKHIVDADRKGEPFMSIGKAVHRLTGELADWYGIDAGSIREGDRADIAIVNPDGLTDEVLKMCDADFPAFEMQRLVNRNDDAIDATLINGRVAYQRGVGFADDLGKVQGYGQFLKAQ
ncbi:MAG: N-acyl-D-amino-acid deacylase family protein [Oceanococcus sp.]